MKYSFKDPKIEELRSLILKKLKMIEGILSTFAQFYDSL